MKKIKVVLVVLLCVGFVTGCVTKRPISVDKNQIPTQNNSSLINSSGSNGVVPVKEQLIAQSKIKKFNSIEELQSFMEESDTGGSGSMWDDGAAVRKSISVEMEAVSDSVMPTANLGMAYDAEESAGASDDYSKTNVQVEGVDEADIVKTDGKYIYIVSKQNLFIIDGRPAADSKILSGIKFDSRPQDIYINNDKLVVFGRDYQINQYKYYNSWRRRGAYTFFKVFDLSDKKNPKQIRDLQFEGNYTNSRMIGDYVYFVTNNYQSYYYDEPVLPRIINDGEVVTSNCNNSQDEKIACYNPEIYYFDLEYNSYNFTSVNAINVVDNDEMVNGEIYLLNGNQNMYVSPNNIYITYTKYLSEWELEMEVLREMIYPDLDQRDRVKVSEIESVSSYILTKNEKRNKIMQIINRYIESQINEEQDRIEEEMMSRMKKKYEDISKELEKTVIHKIAINKGDLEYQTYGEVTGHVLNQFSMDESNGYFRIATTKNRTWSKYLDNEDRKSYNNLFVLDEKLKVVGSLEELAKDETIHSVRFMQNRAYMVTFKQMDPLFVIDLSNPKNPTVLGELKIPGYSDYLHPYDENTLIGIGKDTGETAWGGVRTKGLKISLFDVSDVANPSEIDTYVLGDSGSDSIALRDHKAFLFSKDKNLLVIPVTLRNEDLNEYTDIEILPRVKYIDRTYRGAAVFNITKEKIELNGKISHTEGGSTSSDYWNGYSYYDNTVKRSLYIDDILYTVSNNILKMNEIDDLETVKTLELRIEKINSGSDYEIIN